MAPLTGIAFANNWLIIKLNQKSLSVKTTRVTTNRSGLHKTDLSGLRSFGNCYYGYIYEGSVVSVPIVELYPIKYLGA